MNGIFDIHCHIIPCVDDGSPNMEESVRMLKMEYDQGVRSIIATPHFRFKMFEPQLSTVKTNYELLKAEAEKLGIDLYLGCEFHSTSEMVNMLKNGEVLSMADSRYVLVEFSGADTETTIKKRVYSLISSGYKPIIAHIERYDAMYGAYDFIEELIEMGAYMQINADSILGKDGFGVKRFCKKLMKYDFISYIGSDCHGSKQRISRIGEAYTYVSKKMGSDYADEIFIENPQKIIKREGKR